MSSGSIQRWLTFTVMLAVAASVGVGGIFVDQALRTRIITEAEASLESVLRLGSSRMCASARHADREGREFFEDRALGSMEQFAWVVQGRRRGPRSEDSGAMPELARTEGFPCEDVNGLLEPSMPATAEDVEFVVFEGADGEAYRVASFIARPTDERPGARPGGRQGVRPEDREGARRPGGPRGPGRGQGRLPFRPGERFRVFVATSIHEEMAVLSSLQGTLLLAGAIAVALSMLLVPLTVRRGLRPLRRISEAIGRVDEQRLDQALDVQDATVELLPIVGAFEGVRERLAAAFAREKRFTADAAHELRTPLAGLRASMEVALRRERTSAQYRGAIEECLGITLSMESMVESLLVLAKGAGDELATEPVHVEDLLRRGFAAQARAMGERDLTLQWRSDSTIEIDSAVEVDSIATCNSALAERIFGNLVSNAVQYADTGSAILVGIEVRGDDVQVLIENRTEGVTETTAERAFEPLWRGDAARTDATLHAGLGLSLVEQCVEAIGGKVSVTVDALEARFRVKVHVPR